MAAVPEGDVQLVKWMDATAYTIQERLVTIAGLLPHAEHEGHQSEWDRFFSPLNAELEGLGHQLETWGTKQRCLVCGQSWFLWQRKAMQATGECAGRGTWGMWPRNAERAPWAAPPGSQFIHLGRQLHPSHSFKWWRGVLWCQLCGGISYSKVGILDRQCRMKATSAHLRWNLTNIAAGKCPLQNKPWPLPEDACSPCAPYLSP